MLGAQDCVRDGESVCGWRLNKRQGCLLRSSFPTLKLCGQSNGNVGVGNRHGKVLSVEEITPSGVDRHRSSILRCLSLVRLLDP